MKKTFLLLLLSLSALVGKSQANVVIKDKWDRTPIQIAELKTSITEFIIKDYPGFTINQATRVVKNNVITYEIIIVQGTVTDTLIYDQNYSLVRAIVHNDSIKPVKKIKR
jgi:hypothetical protein